MKHRLLHHGLRFALILLATSLLAQGGPPSWAGAGGGRGGNGNGNGGGGPPPAAGEMAALEYFLTMSGDQLDALSAAIDRVRAMSPEEREAMRDRIAEFRSLPASQREHIRSGWASESDWEDWRTMMSTRTPEERAEIQATLQGMPFRERAAYKNQLLEAWRAATAARE